jgi:hypothetical protein
MGWDTFWATFLPTHPVMLVADEVSGARAGFRIKMQLIWSPCLHARSAKMFLFPELNEVWMDAPLIFERLEKISRRKKN